MECATWTLAVFTGVLALATIAYAYTTWKLYRGSKDQVEAPNELTKAVQQLPKVAEQIKSEREIWDKKVEQFGKDQFKVLGGLSDF